MNLIDFGFQKSNLFQHMPLFDEILYVGQTQEKVRQYTAIHESRACTVLSLNFIRNDEKILWDAAEDLLKRATAKAASGVHGVHTFDLLTIDIHKEAETFNYADLASVIINAAGRLAPGGVRMIKYSSAYALIHKTTADDWGKVTFKAAVDVFKPKPEYLDMLVSLLLKDYLFPREPVILLLNDLSQNPVFDLQNETQQARLKKVIAELIPTSIEFIPEVYIQDKNGARELLSGSKL